MKISVLAVALMATSVASFVPMRPATKPSWGVTELQMGKKKKKAAAGKCCC
jgi:hypothetical protein